MDVVGCRIIGRSVGFFSCSFPALALAFLGLLAGGSSWCGCSGCSGCVGGVGSSGDLWLPCVLSCDSVGNAGVVLVFRCGVICMPCCCSLCCAFASCASVDASFCTCAKCVCTGSLLLISLMMH